MNVLIIYDSAYGNTAAVAKTMATAISGQHHVIAKQVSKASVTDISEADIVIISSPTQGGMPTRSIQRYINELPPHTLKGKTVAAFDTRFSMHGHGRWLGFLTRVVGFAAPRIASGLQDKGGILILPPEGFIVEDKQGPLAKYESRRAADWIKSSVARWFFAP